MEHVIARREKPDEAIQSHSIVSYKSRHEFASALLPVILILGSCSSFRSHENSLEVRTGNAYECVLPDGENLKVTHFVLSDHSLEFVRLTQKDKTYTLPRLRAASGVRFSDDVVLYWNKGRVSQFRGESDKENRECQILSRQ
ncbi:MAG: MliC family protein [Deltaproteobacteria bacterium]|nr:MliC family protein [Deltaproteobacteria bacterium]